jgi:hypothetical protein
MEVTLTWAEVEAAAYAGMKRQLLALHDRRPDYHGFRESDPWGTHIESAGSELAVSKATGYSWTAWARRPQEVTADVGDNVQVRRRGTRGFNLLLHPADDAEHRFVLVFGELPTYTLAGWCSGEFGKSPEFWGDPHGTGRPCFWVPEARLEPMETFSAPRFGVFA